MDFFLGGEFTTYGLDVMSMTEWMPEKREDPMARVFPKVTKCTFHKFGPSGTVEKYDGLCVLPLNIINEKIYVFLWFWFVLVSVITGVHLMCRLAILVMPRSREMLLRARARLVSSKKIETICQESHLGDWFLLYQVGKNMDPLIFRDYINDLYKKLEGLKDGERPLGA